VQDFLPHPWQKPGVGDFFATNPQEDDFGDGILIEDKSKMAIKLNDCVYPPDNHLSL
jgi:hypothetical protein